MPCISGLDPHPMHLLITSSCHRSSHLTQLPYLFPFRNKGRNSCLSLLTNGTVSKLLPPLPNGASFPAGACSTQASLLRRPCILYLASLWRLTHNRSFRIALKIIGCTKMCSDQRYKRRSTAIGHLTAIDYYIKVLLQLPSWLSILSPLPFLCFQQRP